LRCWIGAGAIVNQGAPNMKLKIGNDTIVGSGSVVVKSCDANSIYAGVPARRIR
jgi:acetyltransferase-like isoleucine patch superfamily enzyme